MNELVSEKWTYSINSRGQEKHCCLLVHTSLCESRSFTGLEKYIIKEKVKNQILKWNTKWDAIKNKQKICIMHEKNAETAEQLTKEARLALKEIDNLLISTLEVNDVVDWDAIKRTDAFSEPNPLNTLHDELAKVKKTGNICLKKIPREPLVTDKEFDLWTWPFNGEFCRSSSFFKKIFNPLCENAFSKKHSTWKILVKEIEEKNHSITISHQREIKEYEATIEKIKAEYDKNFERWKTNREIYVKECDDYNYKIDCMKKCYLLSDKTAIEEYCNLVLENSKYPENFVKNFELEYNPDTKILIIEYSLPLKKHFPTLLEVKYFSSTHTFKEITLKESEVDKMFDQAIYKISLRTIHEIFEADVINAIDAISFNGWICDINTATGKEENTCILSLQVKKAVFLDINLKDVNPQACFKALKGVGSSRLSGITPVAPILQINKNDSRIVEGYAVAHTLDSSTNVAAIGWEDFEHLIREMFEKEFSVNGGEVKVTQASRDGGVDAIAFDPDPIRGGKIVIQAKRYSNTVSVSAVRDLYGTVINEGANKGILITTADFGPDSYEFANGKPITLLNGGHLLSLLHKHGHHAKIDIKEAKTILSQK